MQNRYVLITGASKGIGQATALYLDKQGFHVFAGVRTPVDGDNLRRNASERLQPIQIDVTNDEQIAAAVEKIMQTVGAQGLSGLVNNAGIAIGMPLEFIPLDELRRQLEINVVGQVAMTQAALPLIRQARGRIINISSIGGRIAGPNLGAYHASKFAIEAITDTLRIELKPWGVEVVSIEPGQIRTPIWETSTTTAKQMIARMPPQFHKLYPQIAATVDRLASSSTSGGILPEKVAEVIAEALTVSRPRTRYLVGSDANFVGRFIVPLPDRIKDRLTGRTGAAS
jgi:NAD(P)-dependent dehydrogenase (short-subunit alcohol dehydrogenase family)